jgi:hypothetical protein
MSLDDVQLADPSGHFPFLYASWTDAKQISYHAFNTGEYFVVLYDNYIVTDVVHLTI